MCDNNQRKPHVHADIIKAWADGAQVEYNEGLGWRPLKHLPIWATNTSYRVKPESKPLTDLEKYGVEVGDIWKPKANGNIFVSKVKDCLMDIRGIDTHHSYHNYNGVVFENLSGSELLFRRGVVNKL